jgi:dTDP-4-dehydrorhamnose 3,5-epimerase
VKLIETTLPDVKLIAPAVFNDSRGSFFESYNQKAFDAVGINAAFVQDNQSESSKDVLRGLHFQRPPFEQGKLVRVVRGAVMDVVVDMRKSSPTLGQYYSCELNTENKYMLWVPPGFAHGFITLIDHTIFVYKCTNFYHKPSEGGIKWNDPDLAINWGVSNPLVSEKDNILPSWKDIQKA